PGAVCNVCDWHFAWAWRSFFYRSISGGTLRGSSQANSYGTEMGLDRAGDWPRPRFFSSSPAAHYSPCGIFSNRLKLADSALQFAGDLVRVLAAGETHRRPNRCPYMAGP